MGLFDFIPIIGRPLSRLVSDFTGGSAVDEARRQARTSEQTTAEFLAMARQVFNEQIAAVAQARAQGAFNPDLIREQVQRNVNVLLSDVRATGLAAGAQAGDTVQSERIARGAIRGGQALADVPFMAAQRELGLLGQIETGAFGQAAGLQAGAARGGVAGAQAAQGQRLGAIAGLGFQLAQGGGQQAPLFGNPGGQFAPRPGSFNNLRFTP